MVVVKVVDQHVADKVDTDYISDQFSDVENISIVFICTKGGGEEDDFEEDGVRYIVIHLPYEEVRKMQDARPIMLTKAKERLGQVA
jgi:hypothetical protein